MSTLVVSSVAVVDQLQSLKLVVEEVRREVRDLLAENVVLRQENADLRQQVRDLTREVGYWKSRHADVKKKNVLLQAELDQAKAEIRQLKAERFGKSSEKQNKVDRSNDLGCTKDSEQVESFMPWNLSDERLAELRNPPRESFPNTS